MKNRLINLINSKRSFLCIGLDSDINKIPNHIRDCDDPLFEFNKEIINFTCDYAVAYKLNLAFYERMGSGGWLSLEKTIDYLKSRGNFFTIADAKRGDIGNSARHYAQTFFDNLGFDAVTVNPYMGYDTVAPFLEYKEKCTILLALTSNPGANDFQMLNCCDKFLYEEVILQSSQWGSPEQIMYVMGATNPDFLAKARELVPGNFFLVPGVGAQGGDLQKVCNNGMNSECGLIVNSSRNIIYASESKDYGEKARKAAFDLQQQMMAILNNRQLLRHSR